MAKEDQKLRKQALRLTRLSLDPTGQVSPGRVTMVLATLRASGHPRQRQLLKFYLAFISKETARTQAIVEHAGPVAENTADAIAASLTSQTGRVITASTRPNPELLAGLRVILGDHVWDASAKARLDRLAAAS